MDLIQGLTVLLRFCKLLIALKDIPGNPLDPPWLERVCDRLDGTLKLCPLGRSSARVCDVPHGAFNCFVDAGVKVFKV